MVIEQKGKMLDPKVKSAERMCKEEFDFIKAVTNDFATHPDRAWNDSKTPVRTEGYIVIWKDGKHTWIPLDSDELWVKIPKVIKPKLSK